MTEHKPNDEHKQGEGNDQFDRFEDFVKKIAQVPKEELDEKRAEYEREQKAKRAG